MVNTTDNTAGLGFNLGSFGSMAEAKDYSSKTLTDTFKKKLPKTTPIKTKVSALVDKLPDVNDKYGLDTPVLNKSKVKSNLVAPSVASPL